MAFIKPPTIIGALEVHFKTITTENPIAPIAVEILFCVYQKFYLEGKRLAKKIVTESGKQLQIITFKILIFVLWKKWYW